MCAQACPFKFSICVSFCFLFLDICFIYLLYYFTSSVYSQSHFTPFGLSQNFMDLEPSSQRVEKCSERHKRSFSSVFYFHGGGGGEMSPFMQTRLKPSYTDTKDHCDIISNSSLRIPKSFTFAPTVAHFAALSWSVFYY